MLEIIRLFFSSIMARLGRLQFKMFLTRNLPGMYGVLIRSRLIGKHFASAGKDIKIHEGFRFRNIHKVKLGNNVTIGVNSYIQAGGNVEIGNNTILSPNVCIWTHHHDYENADELITNQNSRYQNVKIGHDVWIGTGALINPGSIIGDGAVVRPGSVIDGQEVQPYSIVAGNPIRIIGTRISPKNRLNNDFRSQESGIPDNQYPETNNPQAEEYIKN